MRTNSRSRVRRFGPVLQGLKTVSECAATVNAGNDRDRRARHSNNLAKHKPGIRHRRQVRKVALEAYEWVVMSVGGMAWHGMAWQALSAMWWQADIFW